MRQKLRKTEGWEGAREKEREGERCRSLRLFLLARWEQCRINQRPLGCIYLPLQGLRSLSPSFSGYNPWYDPTLPQPYNRRWSRAKNKGITRMILHTSVCVWERERVHVSLCLYFWTLCCIMWVLYAPRTRVVQRGKEGSWRDALKSECVIPCGVSLRPLMLTHNSGYHTSLSLSLLMHCCHYSPRSRQSSNLSDNGSDKGQS